MKNTSSVLRFAAWLALFLLVIAALAMVLIPVWLIQPFSPQTDRALAISFLLRKWSPIATILAAIAVLAICAWIWKGSRRWWAKAPLVAGLAITLCAVWFSRQNHFEWMFNPLAHSVYAKASDTNFVDDKDMVMAVTNQGEAVAYPIRQMAYHHVVQDVVGGQPIVATY